MLKIRFFIFLFAFFINYSAKAADYYWVGGSGSWSQYNLHWATSSGGAIFHSQVPTPFDNVYFDDNSYPSGTGSLNLDQTVMTCNSIIFSTGTDVIAFSGGSTSSSLNIYGSLQFSPGINFSYSGKCIFKSTSANTISQNGASFASFKGIFEFDGNGGSWIVSDSLNIYSFIITNGSINVSGKKITCEDFFSDNTNTRSLIFANAKVIVKNEWKLNTTNLIADFTGSTIEFIDPWRFNSAPVSLNYDTLILSKVFSSQLDFSGTFHANKIVAKQGVYSLSLNGNITVEDLSSFAENIRISGSPAYIKKFDILYLKIFHLNGDLKIDTTNLSGQDCKNFINIIGSGTGKIIKTSGQINLRYAVMSNVKAQGGASFIAEDVIDFGGNTGWDITPYSSANMYWIGGVGDWNNGNKWSFSSGGVPADCIPTAYNNAIFDQNSFTSNSQTVNIPYGYSCKSIDFSASIYAPNVSGGLEVYGSFLLRPNMNISGMDQVSFLSGITGNQINFAGNKFPASLLFEGTGSWTLQDSIYVEQVFYFNRGTLNTNNHKINCRYFDSQSFVNGGRTINLGSSHIVVRDGNYGMSNSSLVFNAGTSTIDIYAPNFPGMGNNLVYYNVNFFSNSLINISGNNLTFNNVYLGSKAIVRGNFIYDTLFLAEGNGLIIGNSATQTFNQIIINNENCSFTEIASEDGNIVTLFKPSGSLSLNNVTLKNTSATGGAVFNAINCNDLGGNTGWSITPATSSVFYWIGGSGNWTDKLHWSNTSGGFSAGCVPSPTSDVIFDQNSFPAPGHTVQLNLGSVSCKSMSWDIPFKVFLKGNILTLTGSMQLDSLLSIELFELHFSSEVTSSIKTAGVFLPNAYLDGGGSYTFLDDVYMKSSFFIRKGNINFNKREFHCSELYIGNVDNLQLNLDSSRFFVKGQISINYDNILISQTGLDIYAGKYINITGSSSFDFPFDNLHIIMNCNSMSAEDCNTYLYAGNCTFKKIQVENIPYFQSSIYNCIIEEFNSISDQTILRGVNNTFKKADFASTETIIEDDHTFDHLKVNAGKTLKIDAGNTIYINNDFEAPGTSGYPIYILSTLAGTQAGIFKSSNISCFDFLYISDINVFGGATFIAGEHSSDISNNSGWDFVTTCIPFASYFETPVCEGGTIKLDATDLGAVGYSWTGPNAFNSSVKNPEINNVSMSNSGIYEVTSSGNKSMTYVAVVKLPTTKISMWSGNTIFAGDGNQNNNYQWYKNGNLTTDSGPFAMISGDGEYYATITTSEGCSIETEKFIAETIITPVLDSRDENYFLLFPNPTFGIVNVSSRNKETPLQINVYNSLGAIILISPIESSEEEYRIDISKEVNGIYLFELIFKKFIIKKTVVIQR